MRSGASNSWRLLSKSARCSGKAVSDAGLCRGRATLQAVAGDIKALGPDHPDVATALSNLATSYLTQGRYAEAEPLYKRALAIDEKALGPDHPSVATVLANLGSLNESQGRYAEAEPLYKRARKPSRPGGTPQEFS